MSCHEARSVVVLLEGRWWNLIILYRPYSADSFAMFGLYFSGIGANAIHTRIQERILSMKLLAMVARKVEAKIF